MNQNYLLSNIANVGEDLPVTSKVFGIKAESYALVGVDQRSEYPMLTPLGGAPANMFNGGEVTFKLDNDVDRITAFELVVHYANTTANPVVIASPLSHIESISIFGSNGGKELYNTQCGISNFILGGVMLDRTEWDIECPFKGSTPTYGTGPVTIAANTSGSFIYNIAVNFWKALNIRTYLLNGQMTVKIGFHQAAKTIVSGVITTPNIYATLFGFRESAYVHGLLEKSRNEQKIMSYYAPQVNIHILNLIPATEYTIRMDGIIGNVNQFYVAVRKTADSLIPANLLTFVKLDSYEFLTPNGMSLVGNRSIPIQEMQQKYAKRYSNLFISNSNVIVHSITQRPVQDVRTGSWYGGFRGLDGSHQFKFKTRGDMVAAECQIHIIAMCNQSLITAKAVLSTTRS